MQKNLFSATHFIFNTEKHYIIKKDGGNYMKEKRLTGYPSIDKPWLKYYSEEAINAPCPKLQSTITF